MNFMLENSDMALRGLSVNFIITLMASIAPLLFGIAMVFPSRFSNVFRRIIKGISAVTESISPVFMIVLLFYNVFAGSEVSRLAVTIIGFSICFLGYIPSRFNTNYSIGKNIVVNVLGLFADIFKWSLVVGYIGVIDLLRENTMQMARTYEPSVFIGGFIVSLIVLLIINGLKLLFEEIMK